MLFKLSSDNNSGKVNIFLDTKTYVRWWDNSRGQQSKLLPPKNNCSRDNRNLIFLKKITAYIISVPYPQE